MISVGTGTMAVMNYVIISSPSTMSHIEEQDYYEKFITEVTADVVYGGPDEGLAINLISAAYDYEGQYLILIRGDKAVCQDRIKP